jgi:hypothetical protein
VTSLASPSNALPSTARGPVPEELHPASAASITAAKKRKRAALELARLAKVRSVASKNQPGRGASFEIFRR